MKIDYLVDTNIFILLFNSQLADPIPEGVLGYSVITEIELLSFPRLSEEDEALICDRLSALYRVTLETDIAQKTISLRRQYRLKTPDAIIAASALVKDAVLLTNDKQVSKVDTIKTLELAIRERGQELSKKEG